MAISLPAAVRRTRQELADLEARVESLRVRLKALEEAEAAFRGDEAQRPHSAEDVEPRTDAILAVMGTRPKTSWSASELVELVGSRRGTVETSKDVSAGLSYLRSLGKVWSPRRGEWMLGGEPDERDPTPADDESTLAFNPDDVPF